MFLSLYYDIVKISYQSFFIIYHHISTTAYCISRKELIIWEIISVIFLDLDLTATAEDMITDRMGVAPTGGMIEDLVEAASLYLIEEALVPDFMMINRFSHE